MRAIRLAAVLLLAALLAPDTRAEEPAGHELVLELLALHAPERDAGPVIEATRRPTDEKPAPEPTPPPADPVALRAIAEDRRAPPKARYDALKALMAVDWDGRDAWFLERFEDATLQALREGNTLYRPLVHLVAGAPDIWIPRIVPLLDGPSRAAHDNAALSLAQFHLEHRRLDALRPLLPWIEDPDWVGQEWGNGRLRLLQSIDTDMPEALSHLLAVVDHETGAALLAVVVALGRLGAPAAVAPIRAAADRERIQPAKLIGALRSCGGLDDEACAVAIEAHVRGLDSVDGQVGAELVRRRTATNATALLLLARADAMPPQDHRAARALREVVHALPVAVADARRLEDLRRGAIGAREVLDLLRRRGDVRARHAAVLHDLETAGGVPGGLASVIRGRAPFPQADVGALCGVLAGARLVREPLPVADVALLLDHESETVRRAADAWLLDADTSEAREILWARARGQARILGGPTRWTGHWQDAYFARWEAQLRAEVLAEDGEVYALITSSNWGTHEQFVVRGPDAALRQFVEREGVADLPPYRPTVMDGVQCVFLHITPDRAYRVWMNNPGAPGIDDAPSTDVYGRLAAAMRERK